MFHPYRGTVGLDYLTHLPVGNGFDTVLIVIDHMARMAHFCRARRAYQRRKKLICFYMESTGYTDCLECS
jgi:hypothetical protein